MTQPLSDTDVRAIIDGAERQADTVGVPVTVAVTDGAGYLLGLLRMDGAKFLGPDIAAGKAFTAAAFKIASAEVLARFEGSPLFVQAMMGMTAGRLVAHPGGLPILRDADVVGAVGISGGSADQDVEIARESIVGAGLTPG